MIIGLVEEAVQAGARRAEACKIVGLTIRTLQRWQEQPQGGEDRRKGPRTEPANKIRPQEEDTLLEYMNSPEFRDLTPKQMVPALADRGIYLASESTCYRILRKLGQTTHRSSSAPPTRRHRPSEKVATGPCQVYSWDITYLKSPIRGVYFYLYLVMDVWSRKIVGWAIHGSERAEYSARLISKICAREGIKPDDLTLHADNGGPMKGSTMLATLQRLGVVPSFSRPQVSDDNPYSESLFRTLKTRPEYPQEAFASLEDAKVWVGLFVQWYNTEHRHSAIKFLTPEERHSGLQEKILENRVKVYEKARRRNPERWSKATRNWSPVLEVCLNPEPETNAVRVA